MIKKSILCIALLIIGFENTYSQSEIQYRNVTDNRVTPAKKYRNCIITSIRRHIDDGKFNLAVKEQLGVIGNDYDGPQKIGTTPAEGPLNKNLWFPIDGYKRTMIGKHNQHFSMDLYDGDALDDDWNIRLITPMSNSYLQANKNKLENLSDRKYPINYINGEIDMKQVAKWDLMKYGLNSPKANIDYIGMYGPWVYDVGFRPGHGTFIEIHPMEQLWWVEKNLGFKTYHLYAFNDNSGRFKERSDFDTDNATLDITWQTNPMNHAFYVPFEIVKGRNEMEYTISCFSKNNLTGNYSDGTEHFLIYNNKKLLSVTEPTGDILKIDFINVGFDQAAINAGVRDTVIKGFIKIESSIGRSDGDYAGHFFLNMVEKEKSTGISHSQNLPTTGQWKVKATLTEIKCISADDSNGDEDLYGYIGVRAETDKENPALSNLLPDNSSTPLLWSRLDGECLNLRRGAKEVLNKSLVYTFSDKNAKIKLIANLEEDDTNVDNNKTQMDSPGIANGLIDQFDDPDDKLEKVFVENNLYDGNMNNEGVITMPVKINSLQLNQPIYRTMYFGSGGTKIEVKFKIELIEKREPVNQNMQLHQLLN